MRHVTGRDIHEAYLAVRSEEISTPVSSKKTWEDIDEHDRELYNAVARHISECQIQPFTVPLDEPPVTQQTYMEEVLRTYAGQDTWKDKLTLGALGLAGESGEVIDAIKKWLFAGHDLDALHLLEEVGDVLWYMALICSVFGWTFDDAIKMNIEKLRKRYPNGFESERSVNRQACG
jgi:NTP pyrophosphatase (non-canonical NTP hydrolase)